METLIKTDLAVQPQVSEMHHISYHMLNLLIDHSFIFGKRYQLMKELGVAPTEEQAKIEARNSIYELLD